MASPVTYETYWLDLLNKAKVLPRTHPRYLWDFNGNGTVNTAAISSEYLSRMKACWSRDSLRIPEHWCRTDIGHLQPRPLKVYLKDLDMFVFNVCVAPTLPIITPLENQELSESSRTDSILPDFTLYNRGVHHPSDKTAQREDDPTAPCFELALNMYLYTHSERMAEYAISSMFTGIPGCWMRRNPSSHLPTCLHAGHAKIDIDFAVLLHTFGSSNPYDVDRDSNLEVTTAHPALLIGVKGPSLWPEHPGKPHRTLSDILHDLAILVQPSLELMLAACNRDGPPKVGLPPFAIIFGVIYDAERLYIVAHTANYSTIHNLSADVSPCYQYSSRIIDTLDFRARTHSNDSQWVHSRTKLFYTLMALRRHVHRLAGVWDCLTHHPSSLDAEEQHELDVLGPYSCHPRTLMGYSSYQCGQCGLDSRECDCSEEEIDETDDDDDEEVVHDIDVNDHDHAGRDRISSWLNAIEMPVKTDMPELTAIASSSPSDSTIAAALAVSQSSFPPLSSWRLEHKSDASDRIRPSTLFHHVDTKLGSRFLSELDLTMPSSFEPTPLTQMSAAGTQDHHVQMLYYVLIFRFQWCMGNDCSFVPSDVYFTNIGGRDRPPYMCNDVLLNPHPSRDARSLKHSLIALLAHPMPTSFEVPIECLAAHVVRGFLEIRGYRVIYEGDRSTHIPDPDGIVHSCELATTTEIVIPGLSEKVSFFILAVLPWDSRPVKLAQERLALRFENTLKLFLYLHEREMLAVASTRDYATVLPTWCCLIGAIFTRTGVIFAAHWPEWLEEEGRWRLVSTIIDDYEDQVWCGGGQGHTGRLAVRFLRAQYYAAHVGGEIRRLLSQRGIPRPEDILDYPLLGS